MGIRDVGVDQPQARFLDKQSRFNMQQPADASGLDQREDGRSLV